jgi:adenine-specific DNA-methyltransferase
MPNKNKIELIYPNKLDEKSILDIKSSYKLININEETNSKNTLIEGENFESMLCLLDLFQLKSKIDLVYIDPPFSTSNIFRIGSKRANSISSSKSDEIAYTDNLTGFHYLEFIRQRLILIRELMADHASIYFHIDYKIGHYIKIIMDEIFGVKNFKNDISRIKCNPKNFARRSFGNVKDLVLFYTKTNDYIWNDYRLPMEAEDVENRFKKVDSKGRRYTTIPLHAPGETKNGATGQPWRGKYPPIGRHWRSDPKSFEELDKKGLIEWSSTGNPRKIVYATDALKKGKKIQDIWEFKDPQNPDYPTQKNPNLLKQILKSSSNEGDLVLDCFLGSGTTILEANSLQRNWIGIDESTHSIKSVTKALEPPNQIPLYTSDYSFYKLNKYE